MMLTVCLIFFWVRSYLVQDTVNWIRRFEAHRGFELFSAGSARGTIVIRRTAATLIQPATLPTGDSTILARFGFDEALKPCGSSFDIDAREDRNGTIFGRLNGPTVVLWE